LGASESTKVQVNLKANDALINVYGVDSADLGAGLEAVQDNIGAIADTDALLKARFAAQPLSTAGYQTAAQQPAQTAAMPAAVPTGQPATAAGPAGVAPSCVHGQRTYVSGNGAKGPWRAYMCPQPKGAADKCSPDWIK
jgi:hypothetical protein